MAKFERLLLILNLIRLRPGIRASELAKETGVSVRTIFRDILSLASQYPILQDNGYRLLPTAFLKTLNLTKAEYSVFQFALSCPALRRPDIRMAVSSLKVKIDTVVDPAVRSSYSEINLHAPVWGKIDSEPKRLAVLSIVLQQAISGCRAVDVLYEDSCGPTLSRIFPHCLVYYHPEWLLFGFNKSRKGFDAIKLNLFKEITLTNEKFQRHNDLSLEEFFKTYTRRSLEVREKQDSFRK